VHLLKRALVHDVPSQQQARDQHARPGSSAAQGAALGGAAPAVPGLTLPTVGQAGTSAGAPRGAAAANARPPAALAVDRLLNAGGGDVFEGLGKTSDVPKMLQTTSSVTNT
jgi:hypothetical protein